MSAKPTQRWIRWSGRGDQPVPDRDIVETVLRTKRIHVGTAASMGRNYQGQEICWRHVGDKLDIIAWRLPSPPSA